MLTLFIMAILALYMFTGIRNISGDTQAIVLAICIASDLNLLKGLFGK